MDFKEHFNRGDTFFQEGKIKLALKEFEAARDIQPDNADILQMIENAKMAEELLAKQAQASANEAKHRAAVLGITVTDVDKAIAEYTQALKCNPNDASAKSNLASAYYIRGLTFTSKREYDRAVKDYDKAIENEPDYPLAFNKRGHANLEIENYDQAIEDYKKVIQFNPDNAQAEQNLIYAYMKRGFAYDKKGDYKNAIPDYKTVLKFNPDDSTARELLEMAEAELAKAKR